MEMLVFLIDSWQHHYSLVLITAEAYACIFSPYIDTVFPFVECKTSVNFTALEALVKYGYTRPSARARFWGSVHMLAPGDLANLVTHVSVRLNGTMEPSCGLPTCKKKGLVASHGTGHVMDNLGHTRLFRTGFRDD